MTTIHKGYNCSYCDWPIKVTYTVPFDIWYALPLPTKNICIGCLTAKLDEVTEDFEIKIHKDN